MGRIHSIESFGAVDGPGIRFVVFLQGCPMRCKYCHNPDTWDYAGGREMSADEIVAEVEKYKHYFGSTGGVTVSGGEPLVQIDFLIELFDKLKALGINTCIDTSGVLFGKIPTEKMTRLMELTDIVLLDIKHIDSVKHESLTGFGNESVLEFAKYLDGIGKRMWIRHVLVPTINDDEESLERLHLFLENLKNVEKVEVLLYHTMGVSKYKKLGIKYPLEGVNPPTTEQINMANKILNKEKSE